MRFSFHIVTLAAVALLVWVATTYDETVEAAQAMARLTARVSLVSFAFVFIASSWHSVARSEFSASLVRNRRRLGLTFAYAHTIHLAAIITFFYLSPRTPPIQSLVVGGGGYVLMYLMALTSNDWAVRKLGQPAWKKLHTFGIYYIWAVFFLTYLLRVLASVFGSSGPMPGGTLLEFTIGLTIVVALMAFRIKFGVRRLGVALVVPFRKGDTRGTDYQSDAEASHSK